MLRILGNCCGRRMYLGADSVRACGGGRQMFAHQIVGFAGPDEVQWTEVAEPAADGGVVIDVAAAGVSFADLLQTMGTYQMKVPVPYTPGMDAAGVVRSAPPSVGL